ncbi:hypothetical protein ACFS5L_38225 [Streptomyces phyllanthi]|uniref:hypothetical protein n=1 Tax=Streptomyces phyllanthi TaxID=1803180 RepID=UPI0018833D98|nr:hypothetical protein [Streptomyces phyllanthi]
MELQHTPDLRAHELSAPCPRGPRPRRLLLPLGLSAGLGYDAVGTSREHGQRIMECLPRVGCVFADDERWWWIVPAGSDIGVTWPPGVTYAVGARMDTRVPTDTTGDPMSGGPHLIHSPDGDSPYTPPIPLYFLTCRLTGSAPHWSLGSAN